MSRADADGAALLAVDDGVGLDELHHLPGKHQVVQFLRCRCAPGDDFKILFAHLAVVPFLHQQAAAHTFVVEVGGTRSTPGAAGEYTYVLFGGQDGQGIRVHRGCDDHLDELALDDGLGGDRVQRAVEGDDAAEGRCRVGDIGLLVGIQHTVRHRHAAGVGVFDDDAGGLIEGLDAFEGGIGVGDVVERQLLAL